MTTDPTAWLAVVSAEHVERAVRLGIVQTNHGKRSGLDRMHPGDWLVYYSAQERLGEKSPVQAFTAIGRIAGGEPWQAEPQGPDGRFRPWRRRVEYRADARWAPLADLRDRLALTAAPNWGNRLRRGLVPLDGPDLAVIHDAMTGEPPPAPREVPTGQAPGLW